MRNGRFRILEESPSVLKILKDVHFEFQEIGCRLTHGIPEQIFHVLLAA